MNYIHYLCIVMVFYGSLLKTSEYSKQSIVPLTKQQARLWEKRQRERLNEEITERWRRLCMERMFNKKHSASDIRLKLHNFRTFRSRFMKHFKRMRKRHALRYYHWYSVEFIPLDRNSLTLIESSSPLTPEEYTPIDRNNSLPVSNSQDSDVYDPEKEEVRPALDYAEENKERLPTTPINSPTNSKPSKLWFPK